MSQSQIIYLEHTSQVLKDNPLNDPYTRRLPVYLPPGYDNEPKRHYPVVWHLSGFTGWGERELNLAAWDENLPQRLDRLIAEEKVAPVIVPLPDCFTRYGGSQYINSSAVGRYEDYLVDELVPFVDGRLRTQAQPDQRGVMGKSSGGYGALVLAMRRPGVFGAVACHSGDMFFDYCYRNDFPKFVNALAGYDGDPAAFLEQFEKILPHRRDSGWFAILNTLAMSACYSPNSKSDLGFDLPCDPYTGEIVPEVWERWLAWDPINMVERHDEALRNLRCLYLDCGTRDEFHLHLGARVFSRWLEAHDVAHHYEEFDGGHSKTGFRYNVSLPLFSKALSPDQGSP